MIYVGIDTGVNTGFAVWDSKQRSLLQVCSLPIHKRWSVYVPCMMSIRLV